ncbi:MAG: hypothetical protein J7639_05795 [Paenibacillaceae bacterium]|nr:hypothetical protein [Paenibacillaceae bacterium]
MARAQLASGLVMLLLLGACREAGDAVPAPSVPPLSTPAAPSTAFSPSPSAAPKSAGSLRADVDQNQSPIVAQNQAEVRFTSDVDLDRDSVEKAIRQQLSSSIPGRNEIPYAVRWVSDRELFVAFHDLRPRETIHFSAQHALAQASEPLYETDMPHLYAAAFQYRPADQTAGLVISDANALTNRYVAAVSPANANLLTTSGSATAYILSYETGSAELIDLAKGTARPLRLMTPQTPNPYEKLHGYQPYQFSNRVNGDFLYAIVAHSEVYRIRLSDAGSERIYTSPLPLLGISSSPDGSKIGLMAAHHAELRSEADLVVIDRTGKPVATMPEVSYLSHSDGYLNGYPIDWANDSKIRVMSEFDSKRGHNEIDLTTRAVSQVPDAAMSDPAVLRILQAEREIVPFFSPDGSKLVYVTRSNAGFYLELWLQDTATSRTDLIGLGRFIGWTGNDSFVWAEYRADGRAPGW